MGVIRKDFAWALHEERGTVLRAMVSIHADGEKAILGFSRFKKIPGYQTYATKVDGWKLYPQTRKGLISLLSELGPSVLTGTMYHPRVVPVANPHQADKIDDIYEALISMFEVRGFVNEYDITDLPE